MWYMILSKPKKYHLDMPDVYGIWLQEACNIHPVYKGDKFLISGKSNWNCLPCYI